MTEHDNKGGPSVDDGAPPDRLVGSEAGKARAHKLFEHALKAEETRNYDYAVELYVNGLALWPDALDEGLKKLRVVATARKLSGGKPAGFLVKRKYPTSGKDAATNLNNALHLFGLSPSDLGCMEAILQLAAKARCDVVAQWIAPVLADAYNNAKKLSASRYRTACEAMGAAAELATKHGNDDGATEILRAAIATAEIWVRHNTESSTAQKARADATGNLAIVRGKFDRADDFTDSLKDADSQHDLRDRDKQTHTVDRMQQLIDRARDDWEANPGVANKLLSLVDLMVRAETDEMENEAVKLLKREYASSENYVLKQKADDVAIRQHGRARRAIVAKLKVDPQRPDLRKQLKLHDREINEFETRVYEERSKQYPTDMRVKYELARRLFHGGRIDEAIPLFQQARSDARVRGDCRLHLGKCFFAKKFFDQAIDVLRRGLDELGLGGGRLLHELNYWLARALEASGDAEEARKTFGHLIQLDYNYRDARLRLERLVAGGEK